MNEVFNLKRFGLLIRKELLVVWKPVALSFVAIGGGIVLLTFLTANSSGWSPSRDLFAPTLFIVGFILSSKAFRELFQREQSMGFFMLPVSNIERTLSGFLLTGIIFSLSWLLFYSILSNLLTKLVYILFPARTIPPFDPFASNTWNHLYTYLFIHVIFVLGSATFKSLVLVKTLISVIIIMGTFLILLGVFAYQIFDFPLEGSNNLDVPNNSFEIIEYFKQEFALVSTIFRLLFVPFIFAVTYFKLKEREVI